jgi:glycosyltransferase involved in cell wall biosynthesis
VNQPLVTVIINTYNDASLIRNAIKSALNQTWLNLEILVYNNQSTDSTSETVNEFNDPRLQLIEASQHSNLSTARNLALKYANGEFVCFLDSDDTWERDKVRAQIQRMRDSKALFCCTNFWFSVGGAPRFPAFKGSSLEQGFQSIPFEIGYPAALSTIMFRRSELDETPFDESTHITGDYRLATGLARRGAWSLISEPLATIARRQSGESGSKIQMMVQELYDYSKKLRLEQNFVTSGYVANRALEIGLTRGSGEFLRSHLFRRMLSHPGFLLRIPSYFFFRMKQSRLVTR